MPVLLLHIVEGLRRASRRRRGRSGHGCPGRPFCRSVPLTVRGDRRRPAGQESSAMVAPTVAALVIPAGPRLPIFLAARRVQDRDHRRWRARPASRSSPTGCSTTWRYAPHPGHAAEDGMIALDQRLRRRDRVRVEQAQADPRRAWSTTTCSPPRWQSRSLRCRSVRSARAPLLWLQHPHRRSSSANLGRASATLAVMQSLRCCSASASGPRARAQSCRRCRQSWPTPTSRSTASRRTRSRAALAV